MEKIVEYLKSSRDLYGYISSERPHLSRMETRGRQVLDLNKQVKEVFDKIDSNPRAIRLYADFLREVMNDNKTARKLETYWKTQNDKLMNHKAGA